MINFQKRLFFIGAEIPIIHDVSIFGAWMAIKEVKIKIQLSDFQICKFSLNDVVQLV